jgi:hypothetical protein
MNKPSREAVLTALETIGAALKQAGCFLVADPDGIHVQIVDAATDTPIYFSAAITGGTLRDNRRFTGSSIEAHKMSRAPYRRAATEPQQ